MATNRPKRKGVAAIKAALAIMAVALLVSACMPAGVRVPQSDLATRLERKSGLIAFLGVDGNIYTIDQGGGQPNPLTEDAFSDESGFLVYGMPVWSPDSQSVAFAAYSGPRGQNPTTSGLFTAGRGGDSLAEAFTSPYFLVYYYWAPDSRRLGLISETPNRSLAMRVVPAEGGAAELVDAGSPYYWSWAPDGSALMAHAGGTASAPAHLSLIQLGSEVIEYGLDIEPATFKAPAFSPDGSQVLVAGLTPEGQPALLLTDALGENVRTLAEYSGSIAFAWSPDGKRVAYLVSPTPRAGDPGLLNVIDPAGKADPISLPEQKVYAFFWSPDSDSIAYFVEHEFESDEAAGASADAGAGGAAAQNQDYVWDLRVLDAGNGRGHSVSTILATERFLQVIPYFDQYHQSLTIWSPDSKNLVVSAYRPDGTPAIWVAAASGRLEPRYIADGHLAFWSRK